MTGIFLSETGNGERTQNPVRSFPTKILTTSVRIRKTDLVSEKRAGYRIIKDTIEMKKPAVLVKERLVFISVRF